MLSLFKRKPKNIYIDTPKKTVSYKKDIAFNKKGIFQFIISEILCVFIAFSLIFCVLYIYRYATTSQFFNIKEIKINGITHLSDKDIINDINLHTGINSLTINISQIEKKLYENPWIYSASVKRHLPDILEIDIKEKKAAYWIRQKDILYYADRDGNSIAPVQMSNFVSLPILDISENGETLCKTIGQLLQDFQETKLPVDTATITHIRLSQTKGVEFIIGDLQLTLVVHPQDWTTNLQKLNLILHDLASRGELKSTQEIWISGGSAWIVKKISHESQNNQKFF